MNRAPMPPPNTYLDPDPYPYRVPPQEMGCYDWLTGEAHVDPVRRPKIQLLVMFVGGFLVGLLLGALV